MFYVKNVPNWERMLRVIAGLAAIYLGLGVLGGVWGTVVAASAAGIVGSGLFGFCPMCALVGRRLDNAAKQGKI
ncbi:YgaP family membrane protein [Duganella hordei]|uniref:YgaP family membrane protein n=1 Tax=Duganella hordei TaxID=2865934 RepID=UPI0030E866B2